MPDAASGSRGAKSKKFSGATSMKRPFPPRPALEVTRHRRAAEPAADHEHVDVEAPVGHGVSFACRPASHGVGESGKAGR